MNAFNEIYQDVYKKSGMELKEKKKKDTIKRFLFIICMILMIILCVKTKNYLLIIITGIAVVIGPIFMIFNFMDYKKIYKERVIKEFVNAYSDKLNYYPKGGVSQAVYNRAKFDGHYDRYRTEDLIEGTILDKYKISMSEVRTQREEQATDSNGDTYTTYTTLFFGLFASIELNNVHGVEFMIRANT